MTDALTAALGPDEAPDGTIVTAEPGPARAVTDALAAAGIPFRVQPVYVQHSLDAPVAFPRTPIGLRGTLPVVLVGVYVSPEHRDAAIALARGANPDPPSDGLEAEEQRALAAMAEAEPPVPLPMPHGRRTTAYAVAVAGLVAAAWRSDAWAEAWGPLGRGGEPIGAVVLAGLVVGAFGVGWTARAPDLRG